MEQFVSIQLDRDDSVSLYQQLYQELKDRILQGVLAENEQLPSIRKLAKLLGVNNVTIVNAYRLLEQEQLVYSQIGSGTFVKSNQRISSDNIPLADDLYENEVPELKMMDQGQVQLSADAINFASVVPTPELFPVEDFKSILNEVLDRDRGNAFGYQESQGFYPLRESVSQYFLQCGITTDADHIQVISGAQQGIDIIAKSLLNFGDYVITENPTYTGAMAAFKSRGAKIIPVNIETDGISIPQLQEVIQRYHPKLIYVMPNFQNPTGFCWSQAKMQALLKICQQEDIYIIEDDSFTELSYDGVERHPLKMLDHAHRVVYIKSFSKIFMPGLRIAFLIAPADIISGLVAAKHTSDISTSGLMQRAFDLYLRKNLWKKHIHFMRNVYQERYQQALKSMKNHFSEDITCYEPSGGLAFWLSLPPGYSGNLFYQHCLARQVIITPGSLFYPDNRDNHHFRLSFAAVYPEDIETGIARVNSCYRDFSHGVIQQRTTFSPLL